MSLFSGSDFVNALRPGQLLPLGSALHVGVFVADSDPTFVLVLDDCYITQSSNPDDPMRYFLIHSRYGSFLTLDALKQKMKSLFYLVPKA